ncbi:MAG: hypothetical protein NT150_05615 [Bacteroidetes bacterium]|nr:hypothetical protein [Bacteroidota bacterium]
MRTILFTALLTTSFFACGPSAEEMDEHAKKVDSEVLKIDDQFEKELESMGMAADSAVSAVVDSTQH